MKRKIILTKDNVLKAQPTIAEMQELLKGAEKALRKALPHVEAGDTDDDGLFVGEWLGEIADFNKGL
jgi:hypothetical protein